MITSPMMTSFLAYSLLTIGIITVTLIALNLGRNNQICHAQFLRWAHRISGYIFLALYVFIFITMLQMLSRNSGFLSAKDAIHAYIGVVILPLLVIKICIVRFFKKYYQCLALYGITIIIAVFVTVTMSAGYHTLFLLRSQYIILSEGGRLVKININAGRKVVQQKCSTCHSLERVFAYVKTEADWRGYVARMRAKDPAILDDQESLLAVGYLVKNLGMDDAKMDIQTGMKIVLEKCHKCHTLERVFTFKKTQSEWMQTIEKMRSFDPYLLNETEVRQVNYYLTRILAKQKIDD